MADRRVVDREELQGLHVEDPHRLRIGLEQQAEAPLRLARLVEHVAGADREAHPLAQLAGVAHVLLAEGPRIFPAHPQGEHAGEPVLSPQRNRQNPGGLERPVQLAMLVVLGQGPEQLFGDLDRLAGRRGAEGNAALAVLAEDAHQEIAGGVSVRPRDEARGVPLVDRVNGAPVTQGRHQGARQLAQRHLVVQRRGQRGARLREQGDPAVQGLGLGAGELGIAAPAGGVVQAGHQNRHTRRDEADDEQAHRPTRLVAQRHAGFGEEMDAVERRSGPR